MSKYKNIIYLITINIAIYIIITAQATAAWGPKIKLEIMNDNEQNRKLYIGTDTNATNEWDKDVEFYYDTTKLIEDFDLPPAPPSDIMYCALIRDSTQPFDSYTYVDFRSIPKNESKFMHKYQMKIINWASNTDKPYITIKWDKIKNGIDSAKIRCYSWFDENKYVDMMTNNELITKNESDKVFDIIIWFNKDNLNINEKYENNKTKLYPNPIVNELNIESDDEIMKYKIYSILGTIIEQKNISKNAKIDMSKYNKGNYIIELENQIGTKNYYNVIKK